MSHNLHRRGSIESLQYDMPVLTKPGNGVNSKGSAGKLSEFVKISMSHNPVNLGLIYCGNIHYVTPEDIIKVLRDGRTINTVYDNKQNVIDLLKHLKEVDWDLSVIISGLYENTMEVLESVGMKPHSVNYSLGVFGKTELLPDDKILAFTTMCGHHQISANLVKSLIEKIKAKQVTIKEAVATLAKMCPCGIVNTTRAEQMFEAIVNA